MPVCVTPDGDTFIPDIMMAMSSGTKRKPTEQLCEGMQATSRIRDLIIDWVVEIDDIPPLMLM